MRYALRVRRQEEEDHNTNHPYNYLWGGHMDDATPIPRDASTEKKEELVKQNLKTATLDLNPDIRLRSTEMLYVLPHPRVGEQERRLQKAVFKGEIDMPRGVVRRHNRHV